MAADVDTTSVNRSAGEIGTQGKHLIFKLAEEEYGLDILKVKEIIGMMNITSVASDTGVRQGGNKSQGQGNTGHRPAAEVQPSGQGIR